MSLVLVGPRRTYVLLFLWQRRQDAGVAASPVARTTAAACRITCAIGVRRWVWRILIGIAFYIIEP